MRFHRSEYYILRGSGIGSIFTSIFRGLIPLTKKIIKGAKYIAKSEFGKTVRDEVTKAAKRTAVDAGLDMAQGALRGEPIKQSAKKALKLKNIRDKFVGHLSDSLSNKTGGKRKGSKKKKSRHQNMKAKKIKAKPKRRGRTKNKIKKKGGRYNKSKPRKGRKKGGKKKKKKTANILDQWF